MRQWSNNLNVPPTKRFSTVIRHSRSRLTMHRMVPWPSTRPLPHQKQLQRLNLVRQHWDIRLSLTILMSVRNTTTRKPEIRMKIASKSLLISIKDCKEILKERRLLHHTISALIETMLRKILNTLPRRHHKLCINRWQDQSRNPRPLLPHQKRPPSQQSPTTTLSYQTLKGQLPVVIGRGIKVSKTGRKVWGSCTVRKIRRVLKPWVLHMWFRRGVRRF